MTTEEKQKLLDEAYQNLATTNTAIADEIARVSKEIEHKHALGSRISDDDALVRAVMLYKQEQQREVMMLMQGNPYFSRCDFQGEALFFSKFSLPEAKVYSWVTPVARLRFEDIGDVAYKRQDGSVKQGVLLRKDSYVIVNNQIKFFTFEDVTTPRTLVHQEHFTSHKSGFMLPEVVARMEKIQDDIIRLAPVGSMMITGPAGSGKTTLALHRLAFMLQAPESEGMFEARNCVVFVQDPSTRDYFAKLLPELGIHDVEIVTFDVWALSVLDISGYSVTNHAQLDDEARYAYEFAKYEAVQMLQPQKLESNWWNQLIELYRTVLSSAEMETLLNQKKTKTLDRFDVTVLLTWFLEKTGKLSRVQQQTKAMPRGILKRVNVRVPVQFHALILDEFQNYLPEQIEFLRQCVSARVNTTMYVGDGAQKTSIGAIGGGREALELVPENRRIMLGKVYRTTRDILAFIATLGYDVMIPEDARRGATVLELPRTEQKASLIAELIAKSAHQSIGVLVPRFQEKDQFKGLLSDSRVQVMTFREASGVEFEFVIMTGLLKTPQISENPQLHEEILKITRDLNYVALTRAMHELAIFR